MLPNSIIFHYRQMELCIIYITLSYIYNKVISLTNWQFWQIGFVWFPLNFGYMYPVFDIGFLLVNEDEQVTHLCLKSHPFLRVKVLIFLLWWYGDSMSIQIWECGGKCGRVALLLLAGFWMGTSQCLCPSLVVGFNASFSCHSRQIGKYVSWF